jgi:hypothetical protein
MNAHRIQPFLVRVWWPQRASQPSDRTIAKMWPLTIADEKSFRRTFPLDCFMDPIGFPPRNLFNIDHISSSANLPKALNRIYCRLHIELPRRRAPLGPSAKVLSMPARGTQHFRNSSVVCGAPIARNVSSRSPAWRLMLCSSCFDRVHGSERIMACSLAQKSAL